MASVNEENTLLFPMTLTMNERSDLHGLGADCEIHLASDPVDAEDKAGPPAIVVEPPNLCKHKPAGGGKWEKWFDNNVIDETCLVKGFPRIYDEHLTGDETPTNPHHMLEIHPALTIECGDAKLDATEFLAYHDGMSEIKSSSAAKCFDTQLWVRKDAAKKRYEFKTNAATSRASRCRSSPNGSASSPTAGILRSCGCGPRTVGRRR